MMRLMRLGAWLGALLVMAAIGSVIGFYMTKNSVSQMAAEGQPASELGPYIMRAMLLKASAWVCGLGSVVM
jgi:hypothetical protein